MFKKSTILLFVFVMMLSVVPMATAQDAECEGDVTLTYWHHWGGNRIPLMEAQIAAFEEANPGICVDDVFLPWDNRLENLLTSIAAENPPDVTMFGRQDLPFFAATESIIPLDDFMEADGITADMFVPSEFVGNVYNGQTWMLPQPTGGALNIVWYNADHLAEAGIEEFPETWEETLEVLEALRVGDGGFLDRVGFNPMATGGSMPPFLVWLNANGQDWISEDLRTVTINNEPAVEALEFMKAAVEINFGIEELNAFWDSTGEFDQLPIVLELASAEMNGSWTLFQLEEHAETLNYGVAPIPYGPSGSADRRGSTWGGWGYMVPQNAAHPEEAWELVKWLTTEIEDVGACWFLQQQQRPSPLVDCDGYLKDGETHPRAETILGVAALDNTANISPVQPQADEIINRMVDDVMFGDKTPQEALADAEAEIQALLNEFWADFG